MTKFPALALPLALVATGPLSAQADDPFPLARLFFDPSEDIYARALGDLDGDGDADVFFERATWPDTYEVWENLGGLTFQKLAPVTMPNGAWWANGRTGFRDLDGDGNLDFVADRRRGIGTPGWSILPGLGNLQFGAEVLLPLPDDPRDFAFGDFDQNGVADLVGTHWNGTSTELQWWTATGPGTFVGSPVFDTGTLTSTLVALDHDQDGATDALYTDQGGQDLFVVLTVSGAPVAGPVIPVAGAHPGWPHRVLVTDMDGDGAEDILFLQVDFSEALARYTTYFRAATGQFVQGAFHEVKDPSAYYYTANMVAVDWDQDGDRDLIHKPSTTITWVENLGGDQGFQVSGGVHSTRAGSELEHADLDGDGRIDYLDRDLLVRGDGTFPRILTDDQEVDGAGFGSPMDFEFDGDPDLVSPVGDVFLNDGTGAFTPLGNQLPPLTSPHAWGPSLGVADFNGDGALDWVVQKVDQSPFGGVLHAALIAGRVTGGATDTGPAAGPGEPMLRQDDQYHVGDVDADGDPDILLDSAYWINDGTGFFTSSPAAGNGNVLASGDVDGDGDLDLVTWDRINSIELQRNLGGLQFQTEYLLTVFDAYPSSPWIQVLDLDGDADLDVTVITKKAQELHLIENQGGTWFVANSLYSVPGVNDFLIRSVAATDGDGDGVSDLLVSRTGWSPTFTKFIEVHPRIAGTLDFGAPRAWLIREREWILPVDVDTDGDLDWAGDFTILDQTFADATGGGRVRQYGSGTPGSGGAVPVLGGRGPTRAGSTAEIRLVRALGGTLSLFTVGLAESAVAGFPWRHTTSYNSPWIWFQIMPIGGPAGVPGAGKLTLGFTVDPSLTGLRLYHQVYVLDPGAQASIAASNGLEMSYGQ